MSTCESTCFGVATDHRITRLAKALQPCLEAQRPSEPSNTEAILKRLVPGITRSDVIAELNFSTLLAAPHTTGGLLIMLCQPGNDHEFSNEFQDIVDACPSLATCDEIIKYLTGEQLHIGRDVSIIDAFPFTRKDDVVTQAQVASLNQAVLQFIEAKRPECVLCAWSDGWLSDKSISISAGMSRFKSRGIGRGNGFKKIYTSGSSVSCVGAFHPSCAVNYRPTRSCLRQLLILEFLQALHHVYNPEPWMEDQWVHDLRMECRGLPKADDQSFSGLANGLKETFSLLKEAILCLRPSNQTSQLSKVTALLNDLSLILAALSKKWAYYEQQDWSIPTDDDHESEFGKLLEDTLNGLQVPWDEDKETSERFQFVDLTNADQIPSLQPKIGDAFLDAFRNINKHYMLDAPDWQRSVSQDFLKLACMIESYMDEPSHDDEDTLLGFSNLKIH